MSEQALDRAAATIFRLRERLAAAQAGSDAAEPIAVVGMACRFPGADDPDAYWDQLCRGAEAVGPAPDGRSGYPVAGYLADVSHFDAEFFGISAAEAAAMDPQQRLMLELCWEALEDAGLPPEGGIGVFAGVGHQDYLQSILAEGQEISAYIGAGNARSVIANRVSYHFGLSGPSLTVDTACSSSLTAIHLACQSLRLRECGIALAGGVNLILSPLATLVTGRSLPLAPDGRTKTFDAAADGMVRGEGAGVVVLRPLRDAVANKDLIYALVSATACNADGASNGLTAPNPTAQQRLLQTALARAEMDAADIGYLEMHGTGTPLGDAIEFEAAAAVHRNASGTCWIGSVKPNIGHLESAAGVASFIKAVHAVRHGLIPPQIHFTDLSPEIRLAGTRFAIPRGLQQWSDQPRRAGVSSFGFGGTNVHAIVSQPPPYEEVVTVPDGPYLLPLSARSPAALRELMRQTAKAIPADGAGAFAAAAARRRSSHPLRIAATAASAAGLAQRLVELADSIDPLADARNQDFGPHAAVATRWLDGHPVAWEAVYPGPVAAVPLPTYPWQRRRHWYAAPPPTDMNDMDNVDALTLLASHVAEALEIADPSTIDTDLPARDLGVDSMVFVELKNRLETELGVAVPVTALLDGASLRDIAALLEQRLREKEGSA